MPSTRPATRRRPARAAEPSPRRCRTRARSATQSTPALRRGRSLLMLAQRTTSRPAHRRGAVHERSGGPARARSYVISSQPRERPPRPQRTRANGPGRRSSAPPRTAYSREPARRWPARCSARRGLSRVRRPTPAPDGQRLRFAVDPHYRNAREAALRRVRPRRCSLRLGPSSAGGGAKSRVRRPAG